MSVEGAIKSRKAISPILATLLLVVITVSAVILTYAWVMTSMSSAGHQAGVILSKDAVSWPNSTSIKLYVRNTGTSDAIISAVYVGTSATNLTRVSATYEPISGLVPADGGVVQITIENYPWKSDTRYYFKVVPNTGAPLEFSEKSPLAQVSAWNFRKSHIINSAAGAGTNYQVRISVRYGSGTDGGETVYLNGKCRTDFGDVRFTGDDGITLLNYWMEEKVDGNYAVFWVKIADDLSANPATVYIYYGNPYAATTSNAKNTMFIHEDMETAPSGTLVGSAVYDSTNKWVRLTTVTNNQLGYLYYNTNPGSQGFYAKFRFWASGGNGADAEWLGVYDTSYSGTREDIVNGGYHFTFDEYQDRIAFTKSTTDNGASIAYATETTIDNGTWHTAEIYYWMSGSIVYAKIYYDEALKVNSSDASPQQNALNGIGQMIIGGRTGGLTNEHRIDDIIVRKYVYPEPSHGSWGSEEEVNISFAT